MSRSLRSGEREHLNIIDPEAGKRYKLHIKSAVHKLTIGKVKRCLAAASSCPIPEERMVLKLNGVSLRNDKDVCGTLGILSGATLTVEERGSGGGGGGRSSPSSRLGRSALQDTTTATTPRGYGGFNDVSGLISGGGDGDFNNDLDNENSRPRGNRDTAGEDEDAIYMGSLVSPQRRLLELQTLQEQEHFVHSDSRSRNAALRGSLARMDDELDRASSAKRELERRRQDAENALSALKERESAAAKEKARLAAIQAEEEARAKERAADLAARRAQLRSEQDHVRRLAQLKLENEKRKALLDSARQAHEEERRRAVLEQKALEEADKNKQLALRAREIDMEHQRLKYIRGQRELLEERRQALDEKEAMYARMGIEPPVELLRERESMEADAAALAVEGQRTLTHSRVLSSSQASVADSVPRITAPSHTSFNNHITTNSTPHNNNDNNSNNISNNGAGQPSRTPFYAQQQQQQTATASVRSSTATTSPGQNPLTIPSLPDGCYYDPVENAAENLRRLGDDLGLSEPLSFDEANTCVISLDGAYTLLVTYDAATERLFLYSTLLTAIPGGKVTDHDSSRPGAAGTVPTSEDAAFRLKLYEYLLEGSLLGRDMCGGGIGASLKNDFILMSTSIYMPTSQPWALRTVAPQFLQCLQHWRERVADFMESYQLSTSGGGGATGAPVYRSASANTAAAAPPSLSQSQPPQRDGSLLFSRDDFLSYKPLYQQQQQQQQQFGATSRGAGGYRVAPVIGLEVTDTLLVDEVPTKYGRGVLVVDAAGPAALAGLQPHDVLVAIDGVQVRGIGDFQLIASRLNVGQVVSLQVVRGGAPMLLNLQVGSVWVPA